MAVSERLLSPTTAQLTNTVLMVSPDRFGFNEQTASSNGFQNNPEGIAPQVIRDKALSEFYDTVGLLKKHGIKVFVTPSRTDVDTPDAVFPNNWVSFHSELGGINTVLYPMLAPNRRAERQFDAVRKLLPWISSDVLDLTGHEQSGKFLEGTGSLVLARSEKVVFAHESPRTSYEVLDDFCNQTGYRSVKFHSFDEGGKPIYHTNVVMAIGEGFSVVCLDSIPDKHEQSRVDGTLKELGLDVVTIDLDQVHAFCGNLLEVKSGSGQSKIVLSVTAFDAFTKDQRDQLMSYGELVPVNIPTIETIGGGSARCILAEVFPGKP